MFFLFLEAYREILSLEIHLARHNFAALYAKVKAQPIVPPTRLLTVEEICSAINLACIWYPKQVLCLQRSAATACLLKRCGIPAQLVIGAQKVPFKAHAWVEVAGRVVNDLLYTPEMYAVLDRC